MALAVVAVAVAVTVATPAAATLALDRQGVDVGQQGELAGALDRARQLDLVAPAGAGDPPGADLALLRDVLAQGRDVLVVDLLDLVPAERAGLAPAAAGSAPLVTSPGRLAAVSLLGQG